MRQRCMELAPSGYHRNLEFGAASIEKSCWWEG